MSGNICEPTSSATVSGTATTPSSAPAKTRGTFWSTIQNVSAPSVHGTGHVSAFRRIGIIPAEPDTRRPTCVGGERPNDNRKLGFADGRLVEHGRGLESDRRSA